MGLTKNDIIACLYTDKDIDNAIKKMQPFELQDDLRQEMFMVLCEMDEVKFMSMHTGGFLKFYLVRTMLSMIKSDRSTFFNKFRRVFTEWTEKHDAPDVSDTVQTDEITVKLNNSLKILHWYELEILRLYSENGQNIMSLSRDTGIPYRSLMKTIKKTKTLLNIKSRIMHLLKIVIASLFFVFYFIDMARLPERWKVNIKPLNCNMCLSVYIAIILYFLPVVVLNCVIVAFVAGVSAPLFRNLMNNIFFKK